MDRDIKTPSLTWIDDSRSVAYKLKLAKATTMADMADTIIGIDPTATEVAEDVLQPDAVGVFAHVAVVADKVPAKV